MTFSPCSSPIHLVLWGKLHPDFNGFPERKQGRGGKTSHFLALNVNTSKTVGDTPKVTVIRRQTCAFDWHQDQWIWMTLNFSKFEFSRNFEDFGTTSAKRLKIDSYCQRQRWNPWVYFLILCSLCWFAVDFFARGLHTRTAVDHFLFRQAHSRDRNIDCNLCHQ